MNKQEMMETLVELMETASARVLTWTADWAVLRLGGVTMHISLLSRGWGIWLPELPDVRVAVQTRADLISLSRLIARLRR